MTAHRQQPHRWLHNTFSTPLAAPPPLLSQVEMVERILRVRLDAADPICLTCGSVTPQQPEHKWCRTCERTLPITSYWRNRARPDGRQQDCHRCNTARRKRIGWQRSLFPIGRTG